MMLRVGKYLFEWSKGGSIEHTRGVVALVARHTDSGEAEVLEARATDNMYQTGQGLVEQARRHNDRPGVVVGFLTTAAERSEAIGLADGLRRRHWIYPVETDRW